MKLSSAFRSLLSGIVFTASPVLHATAYYWDTDGSGTPGFGTASGTWGTDPYWGTDPAGSGATANTTITTSDTVNFGTVVAGLGSGTIGVVGTVATGNITFGSASDAITLSGGTAINLADASTITVNNTTNTISTALTGAATSLTKDGPGTLALSGVNSHSGLTTVAVGTLKLGAAGGPAHTALGTIAAGTTVNATGTLDLNGFTLGADEALALSGSGISNSGALANTGAAASYSGLVSLGAAARIVATGDIALTNTGTMTGPAFMLTLDGISTNSSIASIIGTTIGGITKVGAGTWTLSGANTYTGQTAVTGGTLNLTGDRTVAPTVAVAISVNGSNAVLNISGDFYSDNKQISVAGGGIINQTAGHVAFLGGISYGGNQLVIGASMGGTYNLSGGSLTTTGSSGENRGVIIASGMNSGTSEFNLSGTGYLNVFNSNSRDSVLDIIRSDNTGTTNSTANFNQTGGAADVRILRMGSSGAGNTANLNLSAGTFAATKFDKLSFGATSVSSINISGTADVTLPEFPQTGLGTDSTAVITFDGGALNNSAASTNYLGVITSAYIKNGGAKFDTSGGNITITHNLENFSGHDGKLTKEGANTLTLTGTNTYTGVTTVSAGTLALGADNVLPDTDVFLRAATLDAATFDDTLGKLDVTAAATIHLGSGANLIFADSSSLAAWAGTLNLTGTFVPGASIKFGVGGLTAAQLASITSTGWTSFAIDVGGFLTATPSGGNTYADWLVANAPATGFSTDTDKDGIPNGVENVLGSNPNTYNAGLTEISSTADSVTFKHTLNPAIASDVTYGYEWSTDLVEWKTHGQTNSGLTTATISPSASVAGVVTVTVTITDGPAAKLFCRLVANK